MSSTITDQGVEEEASLEMAKKLKKLKASFVSLAQFSGSRNFARRHAHSLLTSEDHGAPFWFIPVPVCWKYRTKTLDYSSGCIVVHSAKTRLWMHTS